MATLFIGATVMPEKNIDLLPVFLYSGAALMIIGFGIHVLIRIQTGKTAKAGGKSIRFRCFYILINRYS